MSAPPPPGPYDPNQGPPVPPPGRQPYPQPGQPQPGQYAPPGAGAPQQPGQQPPAGVPHPGMGPGGQPPGQFPPGGPGGQPPGSNRKGLLIGGAIGAAVLLIAVIGGVVYMVADSRPYASVPEHCDEIFSEDIFGDVADGEDITIEGEYDGSEESYDYGYLSCSVMFGSEEDQTYEHSVGVYAEIHDPESRDFEDQLEEMQEHLEDLEAELPPGEPDTVDNDDLGLGTDGEEVVWQQVSPGDLGVLITVLASDSDSPQSSTAGYVDANAFVSVNVTTPGDFFDWEENAAVTESLIKDVSREFSRSAERM